MRIPFIFFYSNNAVERYLSPVSGIITTIFLPLFSGRFANFAAAQTAAPPDIPINMPSVLAIFLPVSKHTSFGTVIISS